MEAPGRDLWLFAYGSLMWAHGLAVAEQAAVRLDGWHRRFVQLSTRNWGTPDRPGLCAVLCPGGSCGGLALRIAPGREAQTRRIVARREANYRHMEANVAAAGGAIRVLTFTADPRNGNFRPDLTPAAAARMIRAAAPGRMGTARSYLENTIRVLETHGHDAAPERDLLARVQDVRM